MRLLRRLAGLLLSLPGIVLGQPAVVTTPHVRAELVAHAPTGVRPGERVQLGLSIQHQPHWHTYWKNPGDSGLPTTFSWQLPTGVQASEIDWPTPTQLPVGPLMNYGYEDHLLLPVEITIPKDFNATTLEARLRADWLVCNEICIPESGEFSLQLPTDVATDSHAAAFAAARVRLPTPLENSRATARVEGDVLAVEVDGLPRTARQQPLKLFAETSGVIEHAAPIEQRWDGDRWKATIPLSSQRTESPSVMHAVLTIPEQPAGVRVRLPIEGSWADISSPNLAPVAAQLEPPGATPLLLSLGLALFGGMLLNLMPCVFPVLSLKVLGFAHPGQNRRTLAASGLAYRLV